ncbi:MAG: tetratricopeptide repeat protein [Gammaproteobacteria bacterium]
MKTIIMCLLLLSFNSAYAQPTTQEAEQLLKQGQWQKARTMLLPDAKNGYHKAQYLLATTYSGRDELQAFKWYMKSAKLGNPEAQLRVGKMYSFGLGIKKNTQKAIFWYKQSAKRGNKAAKQSLDYLLQITQNSNAW